MVGIGRGRQPVVDPSFPKKPGKRIIASVNYVNRDSFRGQGVIKGREEDISGSRNTVTRAAIMIKYAFRRENILYNGRPSPLFP